MMLRLIDRRVSFFLSRGGNRAKSFVVIMVIAALVTVLLRFSILQIIKRSMEQNESAAQTTLKLISTALENYAKNNQGGFPVKFSALIQNQEKYLDKNYPELSPIGGYSYNCSRLEPAGYNCSAAPVKCNLSGRMIYSVSTGGLFISEKCGKKI